jgi:hypothetical protein
MNFLAEHPDYINYFKYTHIPDEMFFQTLIGNSPFADRIQKNNLRYIVFNDKTLLHPKILTINDKDMLMQSSAFFARKFDLRKDAEIIECLKEFVYEQNP